MPAIHHVTSLEGRPVVSEDDGIDALVRAVASGRPGADRHLVDRFKGHVRRLLVRTLGPGPDVEDLTQEVFFRVFHRLARVQPPSALPGYVTTVAVFVAREALRKRRRARWLAFFSTEDLAAAAANWGSEDVPEDVRSFYRAMARVSARAQLCITLRYVEGMGLEEMGRSMDLSVATVKRHLALAERELGRVLGDDGVRIAPWFRGAVR